MDARVADVYKVLSIVGFMTGLAALCISCAAYLQQPSSDAAPCACDPPPVAAAPAEDDTVYLPPNTKNEFFQGSDTCYTVADVYTEPKEYFLGGGNVVCTAMVSRGPTVLDGDVYVTGALYVKHTETDEYTDLRFKSQLEQMYNDNVCQVACLHGGIKNPFNCTCACTPYYTGLECQTPTCFPYGTWNQTLSQCECVATTTDGQSLEGYLDHLCRLTQVLPDPTPQCTASCSGEHQVCVFNYSTSPVSSVCACTSESKFGPNCEYECATPLIDSTSCPGRSSWGHDYCAEVPGTGKTACACGGGYTWTSENTVSLAGIICDTTDHACINNFHNYGHVCCAPGAGCEEPICGATDVECCSGYYAAQSLCMSAGCAWCSIAVANGTVTLANGTTTPDLSSASGSGTSDAHLHSCSPLQFVSNDAVSSGRCTLPSTVMGQPITYDGAWKTWQYTCDVYNVLSVCDSSTRDTYLGIYSSACPDLLDDACLQSARDTVNTRAWPRLDSGVGFRENQYYQISAFAPSGFGNFSTLPVASANPAAPRLCVPDIPNTMASVGAFVSGEGIRSTWLDSSDGGAECIDRFLLKYAFNQNSNANTGNEFSHYYIFAESRVSQRRFCLTGVEPDRAARIQLLGSTAHDANTMIWRQLYDFDSFTYRNYLNADYCTPVSLGAFSFQGATTPNGISAYRQSPVWGAYNTKTQQFAGGAALHTAVYSDTAMKTIVAFTGTTVPSMPVSCSAHCSTLGSCNKFDKQCLQQEKEPLLAADESWLSCCYCLWKEAGAIVPC